MMLYIKYFYYVRLQSLLEESILSTYSCDPCGSPRIYMYIHICKCVYACMYAYRMIEDDFSFICRCCRTKEVTRKKEKKEKTKTSTQHRGGTFDIND